MFRELLKEAIKKKLCPPGYYRDKDGKCRPKYTSYIHIGHSRKSKPKQDAEMNGSGSTNGNGTNGTGSTNGGTSGGGGTTSNGS